MTKSNLGEMMVFGSACHFALFLRQSLFHSRNVHHLRLRNFRLFVLDYVWDVMDGLLSFDEIEVVMHFFFLLQRVLHVI